jgi:hypothetical protein
MNKAAIWWNGVLTVLGIISLGYLFNVVYSHNWNGIFAFTLIFLFIALLWFVSIGASEG